jgi:hypothetical protein
MKAITWMGNLLVFAGALALTYQGIHCTQQGKVLDAGPIQTKAGKQERVSLPPIMEGLALVGALVLLFAEARQRRLPGSRVGLSDR